MLKIKESMQVEYIFWTGQGMGDKSEKTYQGKR